MIYPALLAWTHYVSIFLLVSSLMVEVFVFRQVLSGREMKILQRADTLYGIAALLVLITGFLRVYNFGKGSEYYYSDFIFQTKLGLFIIIGLLSIYPTIAFLKWRKLPNAESGVALENKEFKKIRHFIILELILVLSIPLLAALMARGVGMT